jgi:VanZ family protein
MGIPLSIFYKSRLWVVIWAYIILIYLTLPVMRYVLNFLKESVGRDAVGLALNTLLMTCSLALLFLGMRLGWKALLHIAVPLALILTVASQLPIPEERFHFLQYGLLGILVLKTTRGETWLQLAMVSLFVVIVGMGDELIQWWLPNRVGDFRDVEMNSLAGVMGVWIGKSLFWGSASSSG